MLYTKYSVRKCSTFVIRTESPTPLTGKVKTNMRERTLNPHVSVDCVLFGFDFENLHVLLIDRGLHDESFNDEEIQYALPGDLMYMDEDLNEAADRVLKDLTGLGNIFLKHAAVSANSSQNCATSFSPLSMQLLLLVLRPDCSLFPTTKCI